MSSESTHDQETNSITLWRFTGTMTVDMANRSTFFVHLATEEYPFVYSFLKKKLLKQWHSIPSTDDRFEERALFAAFSLASSIVQLIIYSQLYWKDVHCHSTTFPSSAFANRASRCCIQTCWSKQCADPHNRERYSLHPSVPASNQTNTCPILKKGGSTQFPTKWFTERDLTNSLHRISMSFS